MLLLFTISLLNVCPMFADIVIVIKSRRQMEFHRPIYDDVL